MKKYIRSSRVEELERKLEAAKFKQQEDAVVQSAIASVSSEYSKDTGFALTESKHYYKSDLDAVLVDLKQSFFFKFIQLTSYPKRPGRANLSDPSMISIDPTGAEVSSFVAPLVTKLIDEVQSTFSDYDRWMMFSKISNPSDDDVIRRIIETSDIADEATAEQFLYDLLDSGRVVNELNQRAI